eukprot:TRINITY_DN25446_c0_g1_i1.p1 TRINITY_DN25446_c0_g1~~TRINITY_DN25446_c0_g1_i1.p1  ORF type:complete len:568 (-),score=42.27 TRINITY_DN25446_c0_g1_i1:84-1787(-)
MEVSDVKQETSHMQRLSQALHPLLLMWKVRLPLIALPILAGLRRLAGNAPSAYEEFGIFSQCRDLAMLFAISAGTGFFRLPFSVTWWLILIAAFALETQLMLGVATVLSLTVLLGWYGSVLRHPHAICALWSCRLAKAAENTSAVNISLGFWQLWDLAVHGMPAVLVLVWHGPGFTWEGRFCAGTVSMTAVIVALPLNMVWFSGLSLAIGKLPWAAKLADTNVVYQVSPPLPYRCWRWIYGSHWAACTLWLVFLAFPTGVARYLAAFPVLMAWQLLARSHFREDLLVGRTTFFLVMHCLALWAVYRIYIHVSAARLCAEVIMMWQIGGFGITCGAHRLWSHRSFVAELPFRVLLMVLNCFANQGTIYHWARDHRAHHKWTDTDADPHNTKRGFFYAHMGWLLVPKTEELKRKGDTIACADLLADPVVAFQKWAEERFMFMEFCSFGLPAIYGKVMYSDALLGFLVHGVLRWLITLHATWCVNSVAHYFGERPYDPKASARESFLTSLLADGEGWHSYHHKFPWDYATSEFGAHRQWNPSKCLIDLAAAVGQARQLKRADHFARKLRE